MILSDLFFLGVPYKSRHYCDGPEPQWVYTAAENFLLGDVPRSPLEIYSRDCPERALEIHQNFFFLMAF